MAQFVGFVRWTAEVLAKFGLSTGTEPQLDGFARWAAELVAKFASAFGTEPQLGDFVKWAAKAEVAWWPGVEYWFVIGQRFLCLCRLKYQLQTDLRHRRRHHHFLMEPCLYQECDIEAHCGHHE